MISRLGDNAVPVSWHQHLRDLVEIPTCVARAAIKYPDQVKSIARPVLWATCCISENEIRDCRDSLVLPGDKNYPIRRDGVRDQRVLLPFCMSEYKLKAKKIRQGKYGMLRAQAFAMVRYCGSENDVRSRKLGAYKLPIQRIEKAREGTGALPASNDQFLGVRGAGLGYSREASVIAGLFRVPDYHDLGRTHIFRGWAGSYLNERTTGGPLPPRRRRRKTPRTMAACRSWQAVSAAPTHRWYRHARRPAFGI
jgi:hypothetical protein